MRKVIIYITDNEYEHFIELAKSLTYVKKVETDGDIVSSKKKILDNIKNGLKEVSF